MISVFQKPLELQRWRNQLDSKIKVGFVPTMGALHDGHATLIQQARNENDIVVLSIFVNPTQFNDPKDFEKYPITWQQDLALAQQNKVDAIFTPNYNNMYPDQFKYKLIESDFSKSLCGKDRPGHFDGVLTIVMKLFQLVKPHRAYFGEKDFQQLTLIKGMVEAFFLDLEIIAVPTVREQDGLAMSSRNIRLTEQERKTAPWLHQIIQDSKTAAEAQERLQAKGFKVDYITDLKNRRFAAAKLGEVRLIDNISLEES